MKFIETDSRAGNSLSVYTNVKIWGKTIVERQTCQQDFFFWRVIRAYLAVNKRKSQNPSIFSFVRKTTFPY